MAFHFVFCIFFNTCINSVDVIKYWCTSQAPIKSQYFRKLLFYTPRYTETFDEHMQITQYNICMCRGVDSVDHVMIRLNFGRNSTRSIYCFQLKIFFVWHFLSAKHIISIICKINKLYIKGNGNNFKTITFLKPDFRDKIWHSVKPLRANR